MQPLSVRCICNNSNDNGVWLTMIVCAGQVNWSKAEHTRRRTEEVWIGGEVK